MRTTPLSLRVEARDMLALREIGQEVARLQHYATEHPDRPPRINPTKTTGNAVLYGVPADKAADAVAARVAAVGIARRTGRNDQRVAAEMVLTVDGAWAAAQPPEWVAAFYSRCVDWLTKRYGADNVVSITAHADERAPHVHAVVVPVASVTGRNRYGEFTRERVSYGAVFGGRRRDFLDRARARREGRSAETPLGKLQTEAAAAFADLGIVRGVEGSAATRRHMTRDDWYKLLAAMQNAATADIPRMPPPLPSGKVYADKAKILEAAAERAPAFTAAAREAIADEAWESGLRTGWSACHHIWRTHPAIANGATVQVERERSRKAAEAAARAKKKTARAEEAEAMEKEARRQLAAQLKVITADDLAEYFGPAYPLTYTDGAGRVRPVRTALDRLMHVEGMEYDAAINWLVEQFAGGGEEAAMAQIANTAAAQARDAAEIQIRSAIDRRIIAQLQQLSAACGCSLQVYAFKPDAKNQGFEVFPPGKSQNEWTADDWAKGLAVLKAKNGEGMGIYAFPARTVTDRAVIVVDDIHDPKVRTEAAADAYVKLAEPNILLQTSTEKTQGLFVVPGDTHGEDYRALLRLAQTENREHGDPGVNNLRHAFRLPGFYNHKRKYHNAPPLIRISGSPHAGASPYILRRLAEERALLTVEETAKRGNDGKIEAEGLRPN